MLTLNQNIEILKNFSLKHKSLNSFYFGDEWETDSTITPVYPMMNAILQGSDITNGMVSRRFLIIISDLVNKDESNENHVLSDCELICYDLIHYLENIQNANSIPTFKASQDGTLTDFTERNDDEVSGFFFEITLSSYVSNYSCNLPIDAGSILDNSYVYIGGSTTSCGNFQVLIKDQNGNTIQTFNTSGTYTVEVLQQIIQTLTDPAPSTIIQTLT